MLSSGAGDPCPQQHLGSVAVAGVGETPACHNFCPCPVCRAKRSNREVLALRPPAQTFPGTMLIKLFPFMHRILWNNYLNRVQKEVLLLKYLPLCLSYVI